MGEARGSWDRPSRSALLGLVAAALGIDRSDQEAHDALDAGYRVGVRVDAPGTSLTDYHTAQSVRAADLRRRPAATRRELLAAGDPETILSRRVYRENALTTGAVWTEGVARWSLAEIAQAVARPVFALYAGRKSNPFALPLRPEVVPAESLADAFSKRAPIPDELSELIKRVRPRLGWGREVSHDICATFPSGLTLTRREIRRDTAPRRQKWQFGERVVEVGVQGESGPENEP